ncbi:hypothetical protein SEA_JSQUARED_60 [Mycobacterium phage Jsquared]|nr:hypothetical protein SEA_JSQUARED_60 [Mycobacterium phage Jsquared]
MLLTTKRGTRLFTPVLDSVEIEVNHENDTLTIHAPADVQVVQRCTNDVTEGTTVIFRRKPGVV